MRVGSYNVFEGARDTYDLLIEFVKRENLDVLCIQEATGWDARKVDDFAENTGLQYKLLGKSNTVCNLATFSRHKIDKNRSRVYRDGLWHCAVQTTIEPATPGSPAIKLVNFHLNPFSPLHRAREARLIAKLAEGGIAVGDANNPSQGDAYPSSLAADLAREGNLRYLEADGGGLSFETTDYFTEHGYVDVAAAHEANTNTFPARTDTGEENMHELRLDYFYADQRIAPAIQEIVVIKDDLTARISDHYPSVVTVNPLRLGAVAFDHDHLLAGNFRFEADAA